MSVKLPSLFFPARWPAGGRRLLLVLAWLALTVGFFQPAIRVLDGDLDPSIFSAYAYYTAHGFQFGPEVVAMAGPYGFIMYGHFYGGDLFWLRLACELVMEGIFAALVLWFFLRQSAHRWTRWLWFPAHLLFTNYISDLPVAWAMLLAGLFLLEPRTGRGARRWPMLAAALLGLFALFKGTHLALSFATIAVVTAAWGARREWRHAALVLGAYLTGLLGFWLLARQNPLHLPAYIRGTLHLAESYNSAMSLEEPAEIFRRGVFVAVGLLAALAVTVWFRRRDALAVAGLALLAGYSFVMWKHGFVRADSHVVIFFCFAVVAVLAWYLHFVPAVSRPVRLAAFATGGALCLGALAGPYHPLRPPVAYLLHNAWPMFSYRLSYFGHLSERKAEIERKLQTERDLNQLPETRDTIARTGIDYFGYQQGIIPLNGFNYRPRPMGAGTFNVYDRYLMELNRDFLREPARRPGFYLVRPGTIDDRLAAQDDGLSLLELLHGYRPELIEQNLLLMRATSAGIAPAARPLARQTFKFGEAVTVPAVKDDELLLARFILSANARGKLRATLYKDAPVFINLQDRAGTQVGPRRLVPVMAVSPFLFSPVVEDTPALLALYGTEPGRQPASFTVTSAWSRFYHQELTVEFSVMPRPPPMDPYVLRGLAVRLKFPFANIVPESISPAFKYHNVVRYLHAPSEIVWPLTGVEREMVFHYGIDARAYEEGTTNGVEFMVEVRGPSGGVTRAFARLLKPVGNPADRGQHVARVTLPVFAPGSRLVLRTDPGEYGDTAWDWAYVTRIDIRQGRFTAEQFPGFSRVPDAAEDENAAVVELDGRKLFLLHVPGAVRFNLGGTEKKLSLGFGFLPGAYQDGGNTPGGDVVVELAHPGQPAREIFRRALRPVTAPADRGAQSAEIILPALAAGDILSVRTTTAPGGTNSWGWTYLSRLAIE